MNASVAPAPHLTPTAGQKLPPVQNPRKVRSSSRTSGRSKSPTRRPKSKSPSRRPKRRPESTSTARSSTGSHTSEQVQSKQQQEHAIDVDPVAAAPARISKALPISSRISHENNSSNPKTLTRSQSEGKRSGIQWIIHIDSPGGHAEPFQIVIGLETKEQDDDDDNDDDKAAKWLAAVDSIQKVDSDLTIQAQSKSMSVGGAESSAGDNQNKKLSSRLDSGLESISKLTMDRAKDGLSLQGDDTIEGSEVLPMSRLSDDEGGEDEEVGVEDYSDNHLAKSSEAPENDGGGDRLEQSDVGFAEFADLAEDFDDDQSIDPMENFSPRTSQDDDDDDDLLAGSGALTGSSALLESCSTVDYSVPGSGKDEEEFDEGGEYSPRINFGKSLSCLPEGAALLRAEMTNYNKSYGDFDQAAQAMEPGIAQATSHSAQELRKQANNSALEKEGGADKVQRALLRGSKDSSARHKSSKGRRQKSDPRKSSRPSEDLTASMPELQPEKYSSARHKSSKARREKSDTEKSPRPSKDVNPSIPELHPEKDSSARHKSSKARREKLAAGKSSRSATSSRSSKPAMDFNSSMPSMPSMPEEESRHIKDFNSSVPNLTANFANDFFGPQGVLTSAALNKVAEKIGLDEAPIGLLASMNSATTASSESSSSAYSFGVNRRVLQSSYDEEAAMRSIEQKGRRPPQRTKSTPFAQLDVSAKEGFQMCESKESGEKKSRRRAPSRSKSADDDASFARNKEAQKETVDLPKSPVKEKSSRRRAPGRSKSHDGNASFAQLDLTGHSGVQFLGNKEVEKETLDLPKSPVKEKSSRRRAPGRSKSHDGMPNFTQPDLTGHSTVKKVQNETLDLPKSPVEEKRDVSPIRGQAPTSFEAPTPRSLRRFVRMGSDLLKNNRKLNKSNNPSRAPETPTNKKRLFAFGNASFRSTNGDLLNDDDDSAFD